MKLLMCVLLALPLGAKSTSPGKTRVGFSISSVQVDTIARKVARLVKKARHKK